ncbi:NUDIX domain-containing protein [Ancylobacter sp. A5.8]|uniref:NUDIX hydrolase n=1 Tax=Ancylobacter gelatini TaxID=2919920 RepID=UPI001F4DF6B6|nr:NUDIX domain-containing protein [Ancylobacter gelatini]MCJ8144522.1 NUDIX domain-containing protein [Ancylobacter gelatini]
MTPWRPRAHIRVVAIGLHWREGRLLAAEVRDDAGRLKGVRPLGGGVEFGESWRDALAREFREELGLDVHVGPCRAVLENIFSHEGATGHEVVFVADVVFPPGVLDEAESVDFEEDGGQPCRARWYALETLDGDGPALFPSGLKRMLLARAVAD